MARLDELRFDPASLNKASAAGYSSSESDGGEEDEYLMPSRNPHDSEFADHNPRKRRRTARDAKESAALGIFGSESEDEGPGTRWKRKNLRNKGVSFISSANNKARASDEDEDEDMGKQDEDDEEDDNDDERPQMKAAATDEDYDDDDDEEDEEVGGVGLGFGAATAGAAAAAAATAAAATQGLGWAPANKQQTLPRDLQPPQKPFAKSTFDSSNPLGKGFTPMSARVPILLVRDDEPTTPRAPMPSAFRPGKGGKTKINTGSFGARMMAKMGYVEGKGLGKEGQGRNIIIEANLRPQGIGLGAVKEKTDQEKLEEKRQARLRGEVVVDSDEEEKKRKAARRRKALGGGVSSGPASGASTPRRQKPKYITMDEVKKAAPGLKIPDAFTPILDMTGPGKRMLTSSSGLMTPTGGTAPAESAEAAESRKLTRRAQNDFMAILEEWKNLQERKAYLDLQLQQEQQELEELTTSLHGNRSVTAACEEICQPMESGELDKKADLEYQLGRIISGLKAASDSLSDRMLPEIKEELASLAVAAINPTFVEYLPLWKPLEEPKPSFVDGLVSIRGLLGLGLDQPVKKSRRKIMATPFDTMMYRNWLPAAASAVREWNVREPDRLIAVFQAWDKLMPAFVRTQFLEQDVVRKLEEAVQKWQPKNKHTHNLPHGWIFPWLPFLPSTQLDPKASVGLVADVRRKFRQLISVWEFDRGVIPGLKQWKALWCQSSDQWAPLVVNDVLPSMAKYMKANFRVDPQDQEPYIGMLEGSFKWLDIISPRMIGEVMVLQVFPMWHEALYHWLLLDDANYEEIGQWFQWWKEDVFPDEIKALPSIAAEFEKGTALIERALDLGDLAKLELKAPEKGPALQTSRLPSRRERHHHKERTRHDTRQLPAKQAEEVSFKQMIEDFCQESDLQFIPERKKVRAEGPLYRITARGDGKGGVLIYFKGEVLFVETKTGAPVEIRRDRESDLGVLVEMAS